MPRIGSVGVICSVSTPYAIIGCHSGRNSALCPGPKSVKATYSIEGKTDGLFAEQMTATIHRCAMHVLSVKLNVKNHVFYDSTARTK